VLPAQLAERSTETVAVQPTVAASLISALCANVATPG